MESSILKQIARFLQEQKKQKRWLVVFLCLAIIVGFGTVTALKMRGQAMTHKEKRVICQLAVHQHVDECYDENKENLICGYADYVVHVHNEDCYDWNGNLTCQLPEVEKHEHSEECYTEEATLICGLEETAGHQHGAECYTTQQGGLICQVLEHTHAAECYDETGAVICGLEEHIHEDACYEWADVLICQLAEGADGHTHTEACYEVKEILSCGKLELHTHTDECYEKINEEEELSETNRRLVCTVPVLEEHIHTEDAGCLETVEVTANGELVEEGTVEETAEEETAEGETEEEIFTTDLDGEDAEGEGEEAEESEELNEADEADTDNEEEDTKQKKYDETKTCEGDGYVVTASYNKDANIPEEAEFIVKQITEESDAEHYAEREAQLWGMIEDKEITTKVLLKIGFYVEEDGEKKEVEPETPVCVTVQFLDKEGLPEGAPITVIHFTDEGNEMIDGSEVEGGSTTFEMESFSEVWLTAGVRKTKVNEDGTAYVSEDFEYDHELFHITFHIEGETKRIGNVESEETSYGGEETAEEKTSESTGLESEEAVEEEDIQIEENVEDGEQEIESEKLTDSGDVINEKDAAIIDGTVEATEFELIVEPMDEKSIEYETIGEYIEELSEKRELFLAQTLSFSLVNQKVEYSLSECKITAEITPKESLLERAEESASETEIELLDRDEIDITNSFSVLEGVNDEVYELDMMELGGENQDKTSLETSLSSNNITVYSGTAGNPEFTVQYYAYLDIIKKGTEETNNKDTELQVIDTSGKHLPKNGTQTKNLKLYLERAATDVPVSLVKETNQLTEVYSERKFRYVTAPNLSYFNILAENGNYELQKIAVKQSGDTEWTTYTDISDLHFTNKPETKKEDPDSFILIEEGTTIRLICGVTDHTDSNATKFYDYDISDGKIYDARTIGSDNKPDGKVINRGTATTHDSGNIWYMYTEKQGINSNSENQIFGFGNSEGNTKTGMGNKVWNGNTLNQANKNNDSDCTFGIVESLNDGKIQYAQGLIAPNLFNDGIAEGKCEYDGSLTFERKGDTYTMIGATVGENTIDNLDQFNGRTNWNGSKYIWSNYFWPLDKVASAGTSGHDLMFGSPGSSDQNAGKLKNFSKEGELPTPESDDHKNHNHYFGMYYTVDFDLTEDYVGPLEYLFYGDDDMWVFLEGEGVKVETDAAGNKIESSPEKINGELICDIGGVHSSVGEYVNLWDYIEKGTKGHYKLSFFYTERGASGSTCWMQFTLPSVSFKTPDQTTGTLRVDKLVTGGDSDEEFEFNIKFLDEAGNQLRDDYSYTRYSSDKDREKTDLLIWNNGTFQLKAGEHIIIRYLPIGTRYEITEIGPVENKNGEYVPKENPDNNYKVSAEGNGVINKPQDTSDLDKRVATGTIGKDTHYTVTYTNAISYVLPETGGSGPIIYTMAGVLAILSGAGFMYRKKVRERRV